MRSPAAIRAAAQAGIDLSPVERAVNKFIQTYGPGILSAVVTALYLTYQQNQAPDLKTLADAALAALGTSFLLAVRKWWTAHQDAPGSSAPVEPEPAPAPVAESATVATYPDVPSNGAEEVSMPPASDPASEDTPDA